MGYLAPPKVLDLLFPGHRYSMITIALVAACLDVIKNTVRPKPGDTADQAQRRPEFAVRANGKAKLWVGAT
jgi:hypothetical protein